MNGIYILLGTNMGDRLANLRQAVRLLSTDTLKILNESSIYETEPWGKSDQAWFLNLILQVETVIEPEKLLSHCLGVEKQMGRVRKEKWGERKIDIDILYYQDVELKEEQLTLPHPGIPDRRFTLIPMCELASEELHPTLALTQVELLAKCSDDLDCRLTAFQL